MNKKAFLLAVLTAVFCLFTACDKNVSDKGELISPPALFEGQNEIMKALKASVGENISLEYPKTGENRSAFVLSDLNGDTEPEVIAFYRPVSEEITQDVAHINVLDEVDGNWVSVCDIVGEAKGIDRVSIGNFGGKKEIIVGWELMRDREKTLVCYSITNKTPKRDFTATYVEFALSDFWAENEGDELITLNYSQTTENLTQPTQHARLVVYDKNGFNVKSSTPLDSRVTGYKSCIAGKVNETQTAFFLDGLIDAATVNSQILLVNKNGQLENPLLNGDKTDDSNLHKPTLLTQDMDGDGIFEVPHQVSVTGYEDVPESEKIYKTVFKKLEGNELIKSHVVYINTALGIRITIPEKLDTRVTIKPLAAHNELVFYEYGGSLSESTKEIFSIRVSDKKAYEKQSDYEVLKSNGFTVVTVKITDDESEFCPTWKTLYNIVEIM